MTALGIFWWVIFPYVCLTLLVAGTIWRWRTDQFGWTSRTSTLHEHKLLRWGSPLFHFGILFVAAGHVMGLLIPKSWTEAVGVPQTFYHLMATVGGVGAGTATVIGLLLLIYRRYTVKGVRHATTRNDVFMYLLLSLPIALGMTATILHQVMGGEHGYDYRESISPWLRGILTFRPDAALMAEVPLAFQLHVIAAFLLFAVWPFTRLVHFFSAPVAYPTRPYIVYRRRDADEPVQRPKRGWEPIPGSTPAEPAASRGRQTAS
jgi:nitrate reductase gamma subunit